ncbi:tRNA 5-methylaminomethyl-2-thiouridine biosynthesis bifunctional protein [Pararobbsia alpina]
MTESLTPASIAFREDGTPYSLLHDDIYHSAAGGLAQARHVFVDGNGLPQRWQNRSRFTVLETGFGMGINFLTTWAAWRADPARCAHLHFVSLERFPMTVDDLRRAHDAVISDAPMGVLAHELANAWPALRPGAHAIDFERGAVRLTLMFDDAVEALPELDLHADAFYLDGFAPAKNPELWSPSLVASLARVAHPGATLATYTSAGEVKRALRAAGFEVRRAPGFGWKRHMLVCRYIGRV